MCRDRNAHLSTVIVLVLAMLGGILVSSAFAHGNSAVAAGQTGSPEDRLAEMFAPIVMVKRQPSACNPYGESFLPAPVEVVLDDPAVALMRRTSGAADELVMMGPSMADIAGLNISYYLDFPGNPRSPGCTYELWARDRMQDHEPTTYANIVINQERGQLAIQYWFWYVFNDFNNTHEGDWEMIQLIFDAQSAEEALSQEPVIVGYSQHSGGERADWTDPKVGKEGVRPIVYAARGSHASNYESVTYLAWGEDNSGFGCDVTTGPSDRVEPTVVLLPNDVSDVDGDLSWLSFEGRWGERQRAFFNAPEGPQVRERWFDPFPWQETLRSTSIIVPESNTVGPGPTNVFCATSEFLSLALTRVTVYPAAVIAIFTAIIGGVIVLIRAGNQVVRRAWGMYRAQWYIFAALGVLLLPIGLVANAAQVWIVNHPPGRNIFEVMDRSLGARLAFGLAVVSLQQLVSLVVIGPAVIEAVAEITAGRRPTFRTSYQLVFRRARELVGAVARVVAVIFLLALSVIGIPIALIYTIRWAFVAQAVLIDNATPNDARRLSATVVAGDWWRKASSMVLLFLIGASAGPVLGIVLLMLASPSIRYINWLSSLLYAILIPLSIIGFTLMYLDKIRTPIPAPVNRAQDTPYRATSGP